MSQPNTLLKRKYSTLLNNADYSGLTLTTSDGSSHHAHIAILSRFTDFFSKVLSKKSGFAESATKSVDFPEHTPASVKAFLGFCYTRDYNGPDYEEEQGIEKKEKDGEGQKGEAKNGEGKKAAMLNVEVYLLADYLIADDFKQHAVEKLKGSINQKPIGELEKEGVKKMWDDEITGIVEAVYGNTTSANRNENIRTVVVDAVVQGLLVEKFSWELLAATIKSHNDFTAVVLTRVADEVKNGPYQAPGINSHKCPVCGVEVTVSQPSPNYGRWGHGYYKCPLPTCNRKVSTNWT